MANHAVRCPFLIQSSMATVKAYADLFFLRRDPEGHVEMILVSTFMYLSTHFLKS